MQHNFQANIQPDHTTLHFSKNIYSALSLTPNI